MHFSAIEAKSDTSLPLRSVETSFDLSFLAGGGGPGSSEWGLKESGVFVMFHLQFGDALDKGEGAAA